MNFYTPLVLSLLLSVGEESVAQPKEKFWDLSFYLENDMFAKTDANYTNGIRFTFMSTEYAQVDDKLPSFLGRLNNKLKDLHGFKKRLSSNDAYSFVGTVGQRMYTPTDVDETELIENERPYAGWLYLGLANHALLNEKNMITIELDLGIVGPAALAQEAQDLVHDIRDFDRFQGWDNQLSNEPGFALIYERKRKWETAGKSEGSGADFISHWGGSIGNVATYLNAGAEARFGWGLPNDFGTSALRPAGDNNAPGSDAENKNGIHLFFSIDARAVARDIFLDGNTFKSSHSVDKKNFVADAAIGTSINVGSFKFSYARIFRSKEYDGQAKYHSYGSLAVSYWRQI